MSSSDYRMNLIWTSHGQQLRADLERNIGGLVGYRNELRRSNREMGVWGQQMRAIGTTIRYALAGMTIYGVAGAVRGLGQFLDRLGEIDALAARMDAEGRLQSLGRGLNTLGDSAIDTSNRWGIMVDDILQHQQRFQSTFTPEVQNSIRLTREWAEQMAVLSTAMGSELGDPMALSGGIGGMIQGMGPQAIRNPVESARRLSNIIAEVIAETPNITGADIARDIGRLGGAQVSLRMTPEQIFAVYGTAARLGGASAVIGRGVTQLLTAELVNPQTEQQKVAFRRMGLPSDPGRLREMGGWSVLTHLLGRFQAPTNPQAGQILTTAEDPEEAMAAAGIPRRQVNLLFEMFGRMESARQFMSLLAVGGLPALEDFIEGIETATEVNRAEQMARIRNEQRHYQQLGQTIRNVGLTFARGLDPIARPISRGVSRAGDWVTEQNPSAVAGVIGGVGAASLASKLIFGAGAGGALSRIPGVNRVLQRIPGLRNLAGRAPALAAASLIGSGVGAFQATGLQGAGSRSNPLWVVIDPVSWFMPGAPSGGIAGTPGDPNAAGRDPRLTPWLARNWRAVGAGTALLSSPALAQLASDRLADRDIAAGRARTVDPNRHPLLARFGRSVRATGASYRETPSQEAQSILEAFTRRYISADVAERRLRRLERGTDMAMRVGGTFPGFLQQVQGEAAVTIMLQGTPELAAFIREINRREHVPVKLHGLTGGSRPQFRGQPKTTRGGR